MKFPGLGRHTRLLCILLLKSALVQHASAQVDNPLRPEDLLPELARILEAAQEGAPSLIEQDFLKREADQRLKQARSDYYPRLDLNANFGYRKEYRSGDAEDTDNLGVNYSARLTRPLYHWGAIEARIEQARLDNDFEAINYLQNIQEIQRDMRSRYLTQLLNKLSLRSETARREKIQEDLEKLRLDYDSGKISKLTYDSAELDLLNSILTINKIERDQKRISERFKQLAGWDQPLLLERMIPTLNLEEIKIWLESEKGLLSGEWVSQAYRIQQTELDIRRQDEELTLITARQRPLIDFTASARQGQSNTSTANNVDTFTLFGGIGLSWNIFDGYLTKHQKIEAHLKRNRLKSFLSRLSDDLRLEGHEMLDAIQFQLETTEVIEARFLIEREKYDLSQKDMESGRISESTLKETELALFDQELGLMEARAELLMNLSDYLDLTRASNLNIHSF
ncbi:MAG: TolC family protein [Verrucomicrobiota bacterium]